MARVLIGSLDMEETSPMPVNRSTWDDSGVNAL